MKETGQSSVCCVPGRMRALTKEQECRQFGFSGCSSSVVEQMDSDYLIERPLHVVHVVPTYLPALRYGGPIRSVHGVCAGLAALGHWVDVFTTNVDGPGVSDVPLDRPVLCDGVSVHYYPTGFARRLYHSPAMG